jgi:hypothetical protein
LSIPVIQITKPKPVLISAENFDATRGGVYERKYNKRGMRKLKRNKTREKREQRPMKRMFVKEMEI